MHIHRVYPYLYIPYSGQLPIGSYFHALATQLDRLLDADNATRGREHVYRIQLVSARPFYGFYVAERTFLRISFYNPRDVEPAAQLLVNGAIDASRFQPYEAHIPYTLQFSIDYNLHGMNLVHFSILRFRQFLPDGYSSGIRLIDPPNPAAASESSQGSGGVRPFLGRYVREDFERNMILEPDVFRRRSTCDLECDVTADEIINRMEIEHGIDLNPGIAFIWRDENQWRAERGLPEISMKSSVSNWEQSWVASETEAFWLAKLDSKLSVIRGR